MSRGYCLYSSVIYFRLDNQGIVVRFPVTTRDLILLWSGPTGYGTHPPSYSVGTEDTVLGDKAAEGWSWPLTPV